MDSAGYGFAIFGAVMIGLILLLVNPWTWVTVAVVALLVVLVLGSLLIARA